MIDIRTRGTRLRQAAFNRKVTEAQMYKRAYESDEEYIKFLEQKITGLESAHNLMKSDFKEAVKAAGVYRKAALGFENRYHEMSKKVDDLISEAKAERLRRESFEAMWEARNAMETDRSNDIGN